MIKEKPIQIFLDDLASKTPTPGGGSAAAIMGAMGAALVSMICNLTIGKKKYESVDDKMQAVLHKAEKLREQLTGMIATDVDVFDQVMAAYGLPKNTDEEKNQRSASIQSALKAATDVPLSCARACAEVIALSREVAEKGNLNLVSDAGVAVLAAQAALKSAALNVYINVGGIKDEDFAQQRRDELDSILGGSDAEVEAIYQLVKSKLQ
jgi:formiminotetrahydrofolate cyclodeaminase